MLLGGSSSGFSVGFRVWGLRKDSDERGGQGFLRRVAGSDLGFRVQDPGAL